MFTILMLAGIITVCSQTFKDNNYKEVKNEDIKTAREIKGKN